MNKDIEQLCEDLDDHNLPRDFENAYQKLKANLVIGGRIYWYYAEDKKFFEETNDVTKAEIKEYLHELFSGIVIPRFGIENNGNILDDVDNVVVIVDTTPSEKSYPEVNWVSMKRLLDCDDLIEIFSEEQ